jgi:hypothetical protein
VSGSAAARRGKPSEARTAAASVFMASSCAAG